MSVTVQARTDGLARKVDSCVILGLPNSIKLAPLPPCHWQGWEVNNGVQRLWSTSAIRFDVL